MRIAMLASLSQSVEATRRAVDPVKESDVDAGVIVVARRRWTALHGGGAPAAFKYVQVDWSNRK